MKIDSAKLAAELTKKRMTQLKLASLSGVSRTTISYIKCGKTCSNEVGQAIAKALGVDVTDLLENEKE